MNVHFHLLVPDGVFADVDDGLAFALLPAPTGADLLAILDRVIRRVARRLAKEAAASNAPDETDLPPDLFAQVQAEAATTWRSPATATAHTVHGSDRVRAWCAGFKEQQLTPGTSRPSASIRRRSSACLLSSRA